MKKPEPSSRSSAMQITVPNLDTFKIDTPKGAQWSVRNGALHMSARIFIPAMLFLFGPILLGGLYAIYWSLVLQPDAAPISFTLFLVPMTLFGAIMVAYHTLGKTEFRVRNNTLSYRRTLLGIGVWSSMKVQSLTRIYMRTVRQRTRMITVPGMVVGNGISDAILVVQGEYEWKLGQSVKPMHGQFMKELLKAWLLQIPGVHLYEAPPPVAVMHRKAMMQRTKVR
jgi:hypothetical protein